MADQWTEPVAVLGIGKMGHGVATSALRAGRLTALARSQVGLALADGTRLDDCQLVSISRCRRGSTAWVFQGGEEATFGAAARSRS